MKRIAKVSLLPVKPDLALSPFTAWARSRMLPDDPSDASFIAGAALGAIHPIAAKNHPVDSLWRQRLALKHAAIVVRFSGRIEGEAELRDAWMLRRPNDDPGPAGRIFDAWRRLCEPRALQTGDWASLIAAPLDLKLDELLEDTLHDIADFAQKGGNPVKAAAYAAARGMAMGPGMEAPALWLADAALAIGLKWPAPVPLLSAHVKRAQVRAAPAYLTGDPLWLRICFDAYAKAAAEAFDLHADLARRIERLLAVAPRLRSKDTPALVRALMSEDALSASTATDKTTDRSGRRFFDRLVSFGAVRELTGRSTFRLYGL